MSHPKRRKQAKLLDYFADTRVVTDLPEVYKRVWLLVLRYCDWPEHLALREVCRSTRDAVPNVPTALFTKWGKNTRVKYMIDKPIHNNAEWEMWLPTPYSAMYNSKIGYIKPFTVNTVEIIDNIIILLLYHFDQRMIHNNRNALSFIGDVIDPISARFARSRGHIEGPCPKNWDSFFN